MFSLRFRAVMSQKEIKYLGYIIATFHDGNLSMLCDQIDKLQQISIVSGDAIEMM
jgi:hypothetical protein